VEQDLKNVDKPKEIILGDILAFEGKFMEAEKLYCRNSRIELAIEMYSDLWKYDEAKRVARVRFVLADRSVLSLLCWCAPPRAALLLMLLRCECACVPARAFPLAVFL
jgi:hypothetical protein